MPKKESQQFCSKGTLCFSQPRKCQIFGQVLLENMLSRTFKNAQSGHTDYNIKLVKLETKAYRTTRKLTWTGAPLDQPVERDEAVCDQPLQIEEEDKI